VGVQDDGVDHASPVEDLERAIALVRSRIERFAEIDASGAVAEREPALHLPPLLEQLRDRLRLTPFECGVLLICAGAEIDGDFARACAAATGDDAAAVPSFGLALSVLPEPDWRAVLPTSPLRYWRLIELVAGASVVNGAIRIDEAILHYLFGIRQVDERLIPFTRPSAPGRLTASQRRLAGEVAASLQTHGGRAPVVQLCGPDAVAKRTIATQSARDVGLTSVTLSALAVAADDQPRRSEVLWQREVALGLGCFIIDCEQLEGEAPQWLALSRFIECAEAPCILLLPKLRALPGLVNVAFDVNRPARTEQHREWRKHLGSNEALAALPEELSYQFNFTLEQIGHVWESAVARVTDAQSEAIEPRSLIDAVWSSARSFSRTNLDELARRVETRAGWRDLVLPRHSLETLHAIVDQVRHRNTVYEEWGLGKRTSRGLGVSALFSGSSGTGKTLAAEVVARALHVDLYRIDLSSVVSKYIGETEKNLRKIFDAAESAGVVLLFDEADALFSKRGEVKDSHDRFANVEVGYLLQRMEEYSGLAILTTNLKNNIDQAFLRRLRFVVEFPFPDAPQREEIWRRTFGKTVPLEDLNFERLASLSVAGGDIANIALNAAFLAAAQGRGVAMKDVFSAARMEFEKHERVLTASDTRGWM